MLLLAAFVVAGRVTSAQNQPLNLSNNPQRSAHGFTIDNEELSPRNHGTGIRVATAWSAFKIGVNDHKMPSSFEAGIFHQHALTRALSWQVEGLYYQQQVGATRASGLRLPALLVVNPFYNLSLHFGPQVQWHTGTRNNSVIPATDVISNSAVSADLDKSLSLAMVMGGEARIGFLRVGLRYGFPVNQISNLPKLGHGVNNAWQAGQMQFSLGVGF